MLSNIGNFLLFLNVLLSILIIFNSYNCLKISNSLISKSIYQLSIFQSTSILICFFTLIAAFLISDFSLINVYQNSHSLKPIFYKSLELGEIMKVVFVMGNYSNNVLVSIFSI